jgi:hypothetical protein
MMVWGFVVVIALTVGFWVMLQHYQANVLEPFILQVVNQAIQTQRIALENYHEDRLLPTMTLLASQRIQMAPPSSIPCEVADDPPRARLPKALEEGSAEIEQIWKKVKSSY